MEFLSFQSPLSTLFRRTYWRYISHLDVADITVTFNVIQQWLAEKDAAAAGTLSTSNRQLLKKKKNNHSGHGSRCQATIKNLLC